jgi:hypothetical protein
VPPGGATGRALLPTRVEVAGRAGGRVVAWPEQAVVRCHLLIGPVKFKFDRLNSNLTI